MLDGEIFLEALKTEEDAHNLQLLLWEISVYISENINADVCVGLRFSRTLAVLIFVVDIFLIVLRFFLFNTIFPTLFQNNFPNLFVTYLLHQIMLPDTWTVDVIATALSVLSDLAYLHTLFKKDKAKV